MMFLEAFPLKHVVWILLKHSWCWGPTKCLDFAKCQILKEGLQTSVVEPLIQDQQFWILQNVESKHLKTDTCFPSEYKPGHSGSRMKHVFPSETFGRWENYFGRWENSFGRWENNFGWWENYLWKDNISINLSTLGGMIWRNKTLNEYFGLEFDWINSLHESFGSEFKWIINLNKYIWLHF